MVEYYHGTHEEFDYIKKAVEGICREIDGNGKCHVDELPQLLTYVFRMQTNRYICFINRPGKPGRFFPQIDSNNMESDGKEEILCVVFYKEENVEHNMDVYIQQMSRAVVLALFSDGRRREIPPDITLDKFKECYPDEWLLMDKIIKVIADNMELSGVSC